jgi:hypothetical protein
MTPSVDALPVTLFSPKTRIKIISSMTIISED